MGKGKRVKGNLSVGHRHKGGRSFRSGAQAVAYVNRLKADALRQFDQTRGVNVFFKKLNPTATAPTYGSPGAAGADLRACFADQDTQCYIAPGTQVTIPTGIAVCIPHGMVGLVFARSGLACKSGLAPANKVGVIDEDYRGEIMVCLRNQSEYVHRIVHGDRIAQIVFVPYEQGEFMCVDELPETNRGTGGFGSTGVN